MANVVEPPAPAPAALALNQIRRMRRIVDAAVELADEGGFQAVRLRDVAEKSEVALGTLYKYFRSKEDLLLFALNEEVARLEAGMVSSPADGNTPLARVGDVFERATAGILAKPQFATAVLRAVAVGDPETALKIASLQLRVTRLIVAAIHGYGPDLSAPLQDSAGSAHEQALAFALQQVWFASLVGWSAKLHPESAIIEQVHSAATMLLGD